MTLLKQRKVLLNTADQAFVDNYIKTTKYTLWNFLPLSLLYQYKRLANCYFLLLSILGCIKEISPWNPITQIVPTVFVLIVAILREGYEDYLRYRADKHTNEKPVGKITSTGLCSEIRSSKIKCGDFLLIRDGQELPCDLVLFTSSDMGTASKNSDETQAQCFIQTSSLDGEKNLKKRVAPKGLHCQPAQIGKYPYPKGEIICDLPNANLYEFTG